MARYWVGGTGTWDASDTTHWSDQDGGSGGFSSPTSADDVYFTSNSFSGAGQTVTLSGAPVCHDVTWTGATNTPTLAFGTNTLTVYGNYTGINAMLYTGTGTLLFAATTTGKTVAFAGATLTMAIVWSGAGGGWTLQDAITQTSTASVAFDVVAPGGLFDFGFGFTHTFAGRMRIGGGVIASPNNCTLTITATGNAFIVVAPNPIFSPNTATLRLTGASPNLSATTVTYDTNGMSLVWAPSATGTLVSSGASTWGSGGFNGHASGTASTVLFGASHTFVGTVTSTGAAISQRIRIASSVRGVPVSITAGLWANSNVDFEDIAASGTWPADVSMIGDLGGNSGTFVARTPATYWWGADTGSFSDTTKWKLTSGGSAANTIPLPQDTARFGPLSFTGASKTVTFDVVRIGSEDWTGATNTPTRTLSVTYTCYGSITLISAMTLVGNISVTMSGRGANTITSAGKTLSGTLGLTIDCLGGLGSVTMLDALTVGTTATATLIVASGTFSTGNFALSTGQFSSTSTAAAGSPATTRVINLGSSVITVRAVNGGALTFGTTTTPALTLNAGTSLIILSALTTGTVQLGSNALYDVLLQGVGNFTLSPGTNGCTFHTFRNASTAARTITVTAARTITFTGPDGFPSSAPGKLLTFVSSTPGTPWQVASPYLQVASYVALTDSQPTEAGKFFAVSSTNGGNNTGWTFGAHRRAAVGRTAVAQGARSVLTQGARVALAQGARVVAPA